MGYNNLNLIIVPSSNEVENIIFRSDLNGNITPPYNSNTWNWIIKYFWQTQNNKDENTYPTGTQNANFVSNVIAGKNYRFHQGFGHTYIFGPIIKYKE